MAKLQVTELDFDDIKDNLKTFLKAQNKFKDYDFEGSGMNVLLDTLAYNTHYLAFNTNMAANEMFLDSAALRSSVVSHAKMLGYEVSSARAPVANLNVIATTSQDTLTMPAGTSFNSSVNDFEVEIANSIRDKINVRVIIIASSKLINLKSLSPQLFSR